jgi:hypothetical protein
VDAQFGHGDYDDETLVRAALQAAYPEDRPVFSQRRGEQILRAAAVEEQERGERHPFLGGRVAACLAAAFTLFAGTAGAASAALPGQPLDPIKRVVERAMVVVTTDDGDAARVELALAERRLEEAEAVIVASEGQAEADATADSLERQANEHLRAASALGGDEVKDKVDDLRTGGSDEETADPTAGSAEPVEPADEPAFAPEVAPAPSLSPTPSARLDVFSPGSQLEREEEKLSLANTVFYTTE